MMEIWDAAIEAFLAGRTLTSEKLLRWQTAYQGRGHGTANLEALPEPFLGNLSQPKAVFLALNPGKADLAFQGRGGIFAEEIQSAGSYSSWAASWPYFRDPWVRAKGRNRHHSSRLGFARNWTDDPELPATAMVSFELFPWHSAMIKGRMQPDQGIIEEFVWRPVAELRAPVFVFGAPWLPILENLLGLRVRDRLGAGGRDYGSTVPSRRVVVLAAPGSMVLAETHSGSAGPPSRRETRLLKAALTGFP